MFTDPHQASADASALITPRTDLAELAECFARTGRVRIPQVLDPAFAQVLHQRMTGWARWGLVTRIGGQHRNFDAAQMEKLDAGKLRAFDQMAAAEAQAGFHYLYDRHPVYDLDYGNPFTDPVLIQARELL